MSEIVPASIRPKVEGNFFKKGEKWHPPACLSLDKIPIDPCLSSIYPKITQCITYPGALKLLPLCWDLERVDLGFLQPFGSPRHKPLWFSKPDVMGLLFPVQVSQVVTWTPCSLGENLQGCDIPPAHCESPHQVCVYEGGWAGRVGSD